MSGYLEELEATELHEYHQAKDRAVIEKLVEALEAARDHLDYCGYGDSWERECAKESKLADTIEDALAAGKGRLS